MGTGDKNKLSIEAQNMLTMFFDRKKTISVTKKDWSTIRTEPTQLIPELYVLWALEGYDVSWDEQYDYELSIFGKADECLYNCNKYRNSLQAEQQTEKNKDDIILNMMKYHLEQNNITDIEMEHVKEFAIIATENRKINDKDMKQYLWKLLLLTNKEDTKFKESLSEEFFMPIHTLVRQRYNISYEIYQDLLQCREPKYDGHKEREIKRHLFCDIEKENWKLLSHPDLHEEIESKNLYTFKKLLTDKKGQMFRLYGRQAELALAMKRFTFVVWSRRIGKTEFASYLWGRQLYIPYSIITYIVPTLTRHGRSPYRKFKQRLGKDRNISPLQWTRQILNSATEAELQFYSTERGDGVRSDESHVLIYDECAYLDKSDYDSAFPIVMSTKGMVYAISTFHTKQPQNWFYYKVLEGEVEKYNPNATKYTIRVPMSENPFMTDEDRDIIRNEFKSDPRTLAIEYMCEAQSGKTFNLDNFWEIDISPVPTKIGLVETLLPSDITEYESFILAYDPWKTADQPWFAIAWIKTDKQTSKQYATIIMADYASNLDYLAQVDFCHRLWKTLKKIGNVENLLELNNTGQVITELLTNKNIPHKKIHIHGTIQEPYKYDQDTNKRVVQRDYAVKQMQMQIMSGMKAKSYLGKLRIELEGYDPSEEGKTKRQQMAWWGQHHFDIIGAVRLIAWRCKKLGIGVDEIREEKSEVDYLMKQYAYEGWYLLLNKQPSIEWRIKKFGY